MIEKTVGSLLGGRIRYAQPRRGFRTGIEPVLLAASVPAEAGERVLEAGTGAGAGLLCLASRVRGIEGLGVEREPCLVALANENFQANGEARIRAVVADITPLQANAPFDHAFANPPWRSASGTAPRDPLRVRATRGADLARWIMALAAMLRRRGTITLVLPTALVQDALDAAKEASCGSVALLPLWPKQDRAAKLVLLQAVRAGRAPLRLLRGVTLHRDDGRFTPEAEAALRDGAALILGKRETTPQARHRSARFVCRVAEVP